MKTLPFIIVCVFTFSMYNMVLFAQLNPVNNLSYQQSYFYNSYCPSYNCFKLFWDAPNPSEYTLMAYHIYRNGESWIYTNDTRIECDEGSPCNYPDFYEPFPPFYVTVKAVYTRDSLESAATDSVYVGGLFVNIEQPVINKISLLKNPIVSGEKIPILITDAKGDITIQIKTMTGQTVNEYKIRDKQPDVNYVPTGDLPSGIYILILESQEVTLTEKIFVL